MHLCVHVEKEISRIQQLRGAQFCSLSILPQSAVHAFQLDVHALHYASVTTVATQKDTDPPTQLQVETSENAINMYGTQD